MENIFNDSTSTSAAEEEVRSLMPEVGLVVQTNYGGLIGKLILNGAHGEVAKTRRCGVGVAATADRNANAHLRG